jgi:hypothetical protein
MFQPLRTAEGQVSFWPLATVFLKLFQKIGQPQLGSCPNVGFETFANDLAADFNSAIVIAVADVLQQVRHLGKWAPLAVFGHVTSRFLDVLLCVFSV